MYVLVYNTPVKLVCLGSIALHHTKHTTLALPHTHEGKKTVPFACADGRLGVCKGTCMWEYARLHHILAPLHLPPPPLSLSLSLSPVVVSVRHGFPVLSLPLPSRNETCDFVLRPYLQTVSDITASIQTEDRGIER